MKAQDSYRLAVDVGGTFMDFVLLNEVTGDIRVDKLPSTPDRLPSQFIHGLSGFDIDIAQVLRIFHGTTVAINALVQETGAKVGLITTKGFRDVLEIGRGGRKPVYDFVRKMPLPIVERYLRREVSERVSSNGDVLVTLDLEALDREVQHLLAEGVDAIAIVFLHAYANPLHELAAKEHIMTRYPELHVSASHDIASEWREYERTSTTVLNSFVQPTVKNYLDSLLQELDSADYAGSLAIMQSNGGIANVETAGSKPIRTLMSGPAGGVIGAKFLCDRLSYKNVICTDVGGTTFDVAIIEDGQILESSQTEIAGRPVLGSLIDVMSIGAGGGSVAWLDHRNALQVGPQSAGASPGPACFGLGGTEPTVTDAHLVLGWLDSATFLSGRMKLDIELSRRAICKKIAEPLQLDVESAAQGIVRIAETNMANAIRTRTIERGLDPREFVVLAYGGGGGLFACPVAEELEVSRIILPREPALFSAWGMLTTDYVEDEVRTKVLPFNAHHLDEILSTLSELEQRAVNVISAYGFVSSRADTLCRFDLRFSNQEYTISVALDPEWRDSKTILTEVRKSFVSAHRKLYGHGDLDADLELVSVRARAIGRVRAPELNRQASEERSLPTERMLRFRGVGAVRAQVVKRGSIREGQVIEGPAVVNEWAMTTVIPPGWRCTCDEYENLVLERSADCAAQHSSEV